MSDHNEPDRNQDNNKEIIESNRNINKGTDQGKNSLENQGPQKKHFNVLNEDGSLADLPDQQVEGGGALEGTIGK